MTSERKALERECGIFARYLLGCMPSVYVIEKYVEAHEVAPVFSQGDRFDRWLLEVASASPARARLADAYACRFVPCSLLRKKLVLVLAILETSAPYYRMIDSNRDSSRLAVLVRLVRTGLLALLGLVLGVALITPFRLALGRGDSGTE